jgi:septum formation protein
MLISPLMHRELEKNLENPRLILASTSPFRKALLEKLGVPFACFSPEVDESALPAENPSALVRRLSEAKARAATAKFPKALVIGSDQVAVIGERILGKSHTHERAIEQLRAASGQVVEFLTGLCVFNTATNHVQIEVISFKAYFRVLTDSQIENYLVKDQPYNCAGSFKSESLGVALLEKMEGDDPNALIGLPLIRLIRLLENEGLAVI